MTKQEAGTATPDTASAAAAPETGKTAEIVSGQATEGATNENEQPATQGDEAAEAAKASEAAKALAARKQSAQERINAATRKQREAERERDRALARVRELEGKKAPDPAAFEDLTELSAARVEQRLDAREAQSAAAAAKEAEQLADEARRDAWQERVSVFKETADDFEAVAYSAPINDKVSADILQMEDGPQVAYYLGKHPAEARALNALSDRERAIALGRLSGKLAVAPPRRTTQAPPPITGAVTGKSAPTTKWANLSAAEYAKAVAKERSEKGR